MLKPHTDTVVADAGNASLKRPKFSPGLLLEDSDLTRGIDYTRSMHSLLLRAMLGCGVICGFKVTFERTSHCTLLITVAKGIALDCSGALVELPSSRKLTLALTCENEAQTMDLWVMISRTERCCSPRDLMCCDDDEAGGSVATILHDGYLIDVRNTMPAGACSREQVAGELNEGAGLDELEDGDCACDCSSDANSRIVVLAKLTYVPEMEQGPTFTADHRVRRYIRPALRTDPYWSNAFEEAEPAALIDPAANA
jgi:hypothetical protein